MNKTEQETPFSEKSIKFRPILYIYRAFQNSTDKIGGNAEWIQTNILRISLYRIVFYIRWKGNNMGSKLDSFLRKRCVLFCFVHVVLLVLLQITRKKNTSVGLSYKDVILFSRIFYMFDVVCVKS